MSPVRVYALVEGQTEEAFLNLVISPALAEGLSLWPVNLRGNVSFARLKLHARNLLRQDKNAVLTTFIDLYALRNDFPDYAAAMRKTVLADRLATLESAMHRELVAIGGEDCRPERVIPHIQPHEFEGLLFSDVAALAKTEENWGKSLAALQHAREGFATPEEINGGPTTHPSARLNELAPQYRKTIHGPRAAGRVGLDAMTRECPHFRAWYERILALVPL
ncbi:DUF4276 family protein [Desulfovibrio aminophilus]|nr:DUF4276 family protein [Desulfovibrio aminophilus]MCM0755685.1 DUF4276 family protein [Desulfovibrio aminophilus]